MSSYDDALNQLLAAGLVVDRLEVTGRFVRCRVEGHREKRGWYKLHEILGESGDHLVVGTYGVFSGDDPGTQKIELKRSAFSVEQAAALRKRLADDRREIQRVRAAEAARAAAKAEKVWRSCSAEGADQHPYVIKKQIDADGAKLTPKGALLIPMRDGADRILGLQVIRPPGKRALGKEYWPKGLSKKGAHVITGGIPSSILLVAEGYATARSLSMATGYPCAVAFDAGNISAVCEALKKRYPRVALVICADDDRLQSCKACDAVVDLEESGSNCLSCGEPHGKSNAGVRNAMTASMLTGSSWLVPRFEDFAARIEAYSKDGTKLCDFNDLACIDGLDVVRTQVDAHLRQHRLLGQAKAPASALDQGGGDAAALRPLSSVEELLDRYALVYGQGGQVFDHEEHELIELGDMRDLCLRREIHRAWMEHPDRQVVRKTDVGFDPSESEGLACNLWSGWPTAPKQGKCDALLRLLRHLCKGEQELIDWVTRWLAYPIQHPGAKMQTALVIHGAQGTGKNLFFEAVMQIYGRYGRIVDQAAVEDKFNDWMSAKLFLIADEVVARSELFHVKNKLKSYITGEWIRINPKGTAARNERNRVNLVFLSNEARPAAIEEDDRRHLVIHIPDRMAPQYYLEAAAELEQGGVAALHHYLLQVDLGDFTPSTKPLDTQDKRDLIEAGRDSTSRFWICLKAGEILNFRRAPLAPMLSQDLFELYRAWCAHTGQRAAPLPALISQITKKHGVIQRRERYSVDMERRGPHGVIFPEDDLQTDASLTRQDWLGGCISAMAARVADYREMVRGGRGGDG